MICVGVSARFVPSGATLSEGTITLRGAVILSPIAGSGANACTASVDLTRWPSQIEALLPAMKVLIEPVLPAIAERAAPKGSGGISLSPKRAHPISEKQRETDLAYLEAEWQRLMLAGGLTWESLSAALGAPASNTTQNAAPPPPASPPPPDMLATGGGQMSVLLALERARSLLERIRTPNDGGACAKASLGAMERPAERLRTRGEPTPNMPWLQNELMPTDIPSANDVKWQRRDAKERSRITDELLKKDREAAVLQSTARSNYTSTNTAKDVAARLKAMAGLQPSCEPPIAACAAAAAPTPSAPLQNALDQVRTLHFAGTRADLRGDEPVTTPPEVNWDAAQTAHGRLFALMGQPALARLFNLVIDVAIPLSKNDLIALGKGCACPETLRDGSSFNARFAFVAARLGPAPGQTIWTTTKLRLPWNDTKRPPNDVLLFWACTREELDARSIGWSQNDLLALSVASQIDGMVDLGAIRTTPNGPNPRFELATLDPRRATELDLQANALAAQRGGLTAVTTLPSGGLLVIDRWRQFDAVAKETDKNTRSAARTTADPIVIDAETLTIGYRLDATVITGQTPIWRCLMERRIVHDLDPKLDQIITRLVPNAAERHTLDAAALTLTTRRRENTDQGQNTRPSSFADEIVAEWRGAPLGVDLHGMDTVTQVSQQIDEKYVSLLYLSQQFSMEQEGPDRPMRHCFGWPVRVGLRPQLEGGVVRPLQHAAIEYESARANRFALPPPTPGARGRRVLRHERIEQPVVTTPLGILTRRVDGPQETALELVVRSSLDPARGLSPLTPAATHRVLVPPPVSMALADQHDVFSDDKLEIHFVGGRRRVRPQGGLRDVAYDRKGFGTFPVWSTQQDSAGAKYPDEDLILNAAGLPDLARMRYPLPTGDAVFMPIQPGQHPADRRQPYYPDPAAELMVFRLRHEDGSDLPGESLVVRVRRPGVSYPNVTPIMLEVIRDTKDPQPAARPDPGQERLALDVGTSAAEAFAHGHAAWTKPAARIFLDGTATANRQRGKIEATRVVVRLAPHERFQLDIWCLPRPETLAYLFDIVESAAAALAATLSTDAQGCLSGTAFCERLAASIGREPQEILAIWHELIQGKAARAPSGPCGVGQLQLPGPEELRLVAEVLQRAATDIVSPELAARLTLWVTHAVDRPLEPPSFAVPTPLSLGRPATGTPADATSRVELAGCVGIHQASTRFLEVEARAPSLITGTFDDPRRGRSSDDQARGIWPSEGTELAGKDERVVWRTPGAMFGFKVAPNGLVTLLDETATLLRIDAIPAHPAPGAAPGIIDLAALEATLRPKSDTAPDTAPILPLPAATATRPQSIADLKARVLTFNLVAGSRTAPLIRKAKDGKALEAEQQTLPTPSGAELRIPLPAAAAPTRVAPLTILPAFRLEHEGQTVTRHTRLRIRARRPWFSSGAGERLGIVLWPPDFSKRLKHPDLVERDTDVESYPPYLSEMQMAGFSDLDLGPGGEFVTRWGGDPTKDGAAPATWLVPPTAFFKPDAWTKAKLKPWRPQDSADEHAEFVYVPRATMPLPNDQPDAGSNAHPATMEVALLTLVPRFDVDLENWYFDLEIDAAAAAEPFIRLGLVRYQWNAPAHLRVSEPIVEWAQLLPERKMTVQKPLLIKGKYEVTVVVTGAAGRQRSPSSGNGELQPRMEIEAWRYDRNDVPTRRISATADPTDNSSSGTQWDKTLILDEDPTSPPSGVRYAITATEHNVLRPATYEMEPFDSIRDPDKTCSSGPRFAARVDLPAPTNTPASTTQETDEPSLLIHEG